MTLDGVMAADPRYLCDSRASCSQLRTEVGVVTLAVDLQY